MTQHDHELPPVKVAFIIDNIVADVIHTDNRLAAIFLSNPVVMDVTDHEDASSITTNATYNPETQTFTPAPLVIQEPLPITPGSFVTDENGGDDQLLMIPLDPPA